MKELFSALCISERERISGADMCFEFGSDYIKKDGARVYLEYGMPEKYYAYLETCLAKDGKPYAELLSITGTEIMKRLSRLQNSP